MAPAASGAPAPAAADPDLAAVQAVCGRCHSLQLVTSQARSETEWMGLLQKMADLGARGSDEQFDAVVRYLRARLTFINVNEASADELVRILGVPSAVAEAIVTRRQTRRFSDLADLETVGGINRAAMDVRESRILF
jgi:competence protein ComEA